jgi:hypothetical protein
MVQLWASYYWRKFVKLVTAAVGLGCSDGNVHARLKGWK